MHVGGEDLYKEIVACLRGLLNSLLLLQWFSLMDFSFLFIFSLMLKIVLCVFIFFTCSVIHSFFRSML